MLRNYKKPEPTPNNQKAHIEAIKERHSQQLNGLYQLQAAQLAQLAEDQHMMATESLGAEEEQQAVRYPRFSN